MEKLDSIARIVELIVAIVGASVITRIITIRQRVRQEKAGADKAEQEVKSDQIENIEKMVEKAYKPIIEDLTRQVKALQEKVEKLEAEKDEKNERIDELEGEVRRLRNALQQDHPEVIPSKRSENARRQARGSNGQFAKAGGGEGSE